MKKLTRLSILAAGLLPAAAFADNLEWINPGTSSWFNAANWNPSATPTAADYTQISAGTALVDAAGAASADINVSFAGALTVANGGTLTSGFRLGVNLGGSATFTGAGSSFLGSELALAKQGVGSVEISDGATMTLLDTGEGSGVGIAQWYGPEMGDGGSSTGTLTVTGAGSKLTSRNGIYMAMVAAPFFPPPDEPNVVNGTVNIANGGQVILGTSTYMVQFDAGYAEGQLTTATAAVNVSGAGSLLEVDHMALGQQRDGGSATASLSISSGAVVQSTRIVLGDANGATGNLTISGTAGSRGVLETERVTLNHGSITFDGGTLRVVSASTGYISPIQLVNDDDVVTVNEGGVFVDTNGHDEVNLYKFVGVGGLTKLGTGSLALQQSELAGGVTVEAGTLVFGGNSSAAAAPLVVNGGIANVQGSSYIGGVNVSSLSGTGGVIWVGDGGLKVNQTADTTYAGDIIDNGYPGWLVKSGAGTLELNGNNTYLGGTTVEGGTLRAGSATAIPQNSSFAVNGGTLDLNGHDLTMSNLTSTGGEIKLGDATLTLNQATNATVAAAISGGGRLVKTGAGTTALTGANTFSTAGEFTETVVIRQGTLSVGGSAASLSAADSAIYVGDGSGDDATLEIFGGASVVSKRGYIGTDADAIGSVTVSGPGSEWESATSLAVGYEGSGQLQILSGASVSTKEAIIGHAGTGSGSVVVGGAGSTFDSNILYVGNGKTGTLIIAEGATVNVTADPEVANSGTVIVGANAGVAGTLTFGSGSLDATGGTLVAEKVEFRSADSQIRFQQTDLTTLSADISGPGSVSQLGSGTSTLTGANTYTGATFVNAGTLLVNGTITSDATVGNGATFGGDGIVGGITLESGAALAPGGGTAIGTLDATTLIWNIGANFVFDLGATASDLVNLSGALTKAGTGTFQFHFRDAGWEVGHTYTLIDFASTNFTSADFGFTGAPGGFDGTFRFSGNSLQFTLVAIPEPSTWGLIMAGMLAAMGLARRKRSTISPPRATP